MTSKQMTEFVKQEVLTFRLGSWRFAFDLTLIREIIRVPRLTRVPLTPGYVLGVMNLRGNVITVVSGTRRALSQTPDRSERCRVLVIDHGANAIGVLVEEVDRICFLEAGNAEISADDQSSEFVSEILRQNDETVFKLDPEKLLPKLETKRIASPRDPNFIQERSEQSDHRVGDEKKALIVQLGREEFGIPIELVTEILRFTPPNPIPDSPAYLLGVITLRSRLLPVFDLRTLLRRPPVQTEYGDKRATEGKTLVIETDNSYFGLVVDHVTQILNLPLASIKAPPPITKESGVKLEGLIQLNESNRLILLLQLAELIDKNRLPESLKQSLLTTGNRPESMETQVNSAGRWICFSLDAEEFGLQLEEVLEIGRLEEITSVPTSPRFVKGVLNLRGEVVPIIDLRTRFGLPSSVPSLRSRIVYILANQVKLGLIVDSVSQIMNLKTDDISLTPAGICSPVVSEYLTAIAKHQDRMVLLLNASTLFTKAEKEKVAKVSQSDITATGPKNTKPRSKRT